MVVEVDVVVVEFETAPKLKATPKPFPPEQFRRKGTRYVWIPLSLKYAITLSTIPRLVAVQWQWQRKTT